MFDDEYFIYEFLYQELPGDCTQTRHLFGLAWGKPRWVRSSNGSNWPCWQKTKGLTTQETVRCARLARFLAPCSLLGSAWHVPQTNPLYDGLKGAPPVFSGAGTLNHCSFAELSTFATTRLWEQTNRQPDDQPRVQWVPYEQKSWKWTALGSVPRSRILISQNYVARTGLHLS